METRRVVQRVPLTLYPEQLRDTRHGINESIRNMLNKYNTDMNGVPLSYSKIKLDSTISNVFEDCPVLNVHAKVTFQVFSPKKGDVLSGVVNKITIDHIGVLVHDRFNASIPRNTLPSDLVYNMDDNCFTNETSGDTVIQVGSDVNISVDYLESSHGVVSIIGKLASQ